MSISLTSRVFFYKNYSDTHSAILPSSVLLFNNLHHKLFYGAAQKFGLHEYRKRDKNKEKSKAIQDLAEAFNDVKLYQEGKNHLISAKDLLIEL